MTTYIKGTFPVRFRKDGKDGVNVWVKYATVLDLTDSNTGKSYPSNKYIHNEPTADCKYIGIGKGVGDEPTQGQYYEWKKYIGDDGTSFTAKGQAITHYATLTDYDNATSKSVGLYLIDDSAGALLKYWNGSASEDRSVTDGDAYTTADKHLWVKDVAKWNDLGEIQGPKGDPAYIDTIYLKGASYNTAGAPNAKVTITKNNTSRTYEASTRGLHAYKIDRTTLVGTKIGAYDTYINTATADTLATKINELDTTVFLAIVSFDACGFTSNFVTAIKQFGGNDIADLTAKRQAFCFLGYKGMAQGTALQVLNVGDAKISEISSIVSNGVCQGSGQGGNSIISVTNYYLAGSSSSTAPTGIWVTDPSKSGFSASKPYLWGYEETKFSLSSIKETTKRVIGVWSKDGKGIKSIIEYYLATSASSGVTTSMGDWPWTTTIQTISPSKKYLWNFERIVYTNSTYTDSDPCIIGVYGDKGDPGEAAYSYKLRSNITAIPLDNNGMPVDSAKSLTLTGNIFKGSSSISVSTSYTIKAIITWNGTASATKTSSNGSLTVDLSTYKNIVKVACSFLYGSTVLDSFDILPIKAGAAGVSYFPNMRGYWQAGSSYSWLNGSRDMVTYNKDGVAYLYGVKTAGTTVTTRPLSDAGTVNSGWEEAATPFSMLFANFVYTDNASVAGFVWSDLKMKSPNGKLILNGNTGEFVANKATIRGEVNATSGTFENCAITNTCRIHQTGGNGWFLVGAQAPSEDKPNGEPSWWLGYSGVMVGSFSMEVSNPSNSSMKSSLHITPNIPSSTITYANAILKIDSIYQTLASFNQDGGMNVQIGYDIGEGIRFTKNISNNTFQAFVGSGHGCLNGVIQGYQINNTLPSNGVIDLSYGNTVYCAKQGGSITLPTSTNCGRVLGTKGAFAIDLTIIAASGASNFKVYGKSDDNNTDCFLLNNNHANNWNATMSQGDVLQLKLIYTGSYFYAYIVSFKQ